MAIVYLRLPTGWEPVHESILVLQNTKELKRFEIAENKINLYFNEVCLFKNF